MTVARFFERTYAAVGRHIAVDRATLEGRLAGLTVGVRCGDECTRDENPRWIAELAVNLFARFYPAISIEAPQDFRLQLVRQAMAINPDIEIRAVTSADIVVATAQSAAGHRSIYTRADGWVAEVAHHPLLAGAGPANPYAAGAAAALAVAAIFDDVFPQGDGRFPTVAVSLLNYSEAAGRDRPLGIRRLDRTLLAGLGAVGNAAVWALSRDTLLQGSATILDPEAVDLSNLQRYVLTVDTDVGRQKVDIAREAFRESTLTLEARQTTIEDCPDLGSFDSILVSTDNVPSRRFVQACLPRLVVNGWTSESGLGASWHRLGNGAACLGCLYQPTGVAPSQTELVAQALGLPHQRVIQLWVAPIGLNQADIDGIAEHLGLGREQLSPWRAKQIQDLYSDIICGTVALDVKGVGRLEAVPLAHQSVLAGVLAAAELVKRTDAEVEAASQAETAIAWHDVLRPPPARWGQARAPVDGCICGDPDYTDAYARKWPTAPVRGPSSHPATASGSK
jgi:hypothetical protein